MAGHEMRFECTACGKCCYGGDDYFVPLTDAEAEAIQCALDIGADWFRRRYLQTDAYLGKGLQFRENGACALLGRNGRCRVYAQRPQQCRTYPFWPELLSSARAWRLESVRCEGIGRGPVISRESLKQGKT